MDQLVYVSGFVDCIEINSTFYTPAKPDTAKAWTERTKHIPGFTFTAKVPNTITHERSLEKYFVERFKRGMAPLVEANKLSHLIAQFRYDFEANDDNRKHVAETANVLRDLTNITLELRHNSWQTPANLDFLRELGVTVANLDYPTGKDSFNLQHCDVGKEAYLRLHGRNHKAWFDSKADRNETYNYKYSDAELNELQDRAQKLAKASNTLTVIANNHYRGKEFVTALQLKAMLQKDQVEVPTLLAEHYPELKSLAN